VTRLCIILCACVDIGITVEEGIFVSSIEPGSAAAVDETVIVGDRLLSVSTSIFVVGHL